MRLDIYLVKTGRAESRERAQELIGLGNVLINRKPCTKNSKDISDSDSVTVTESLPYVGRGGYKLEKALDFFGISLEGKTVLDIGASTGGFTDCALQRGAKEVYAVDVGHDQLAMSLREDPRVHNLEGVHIKDLSAHYTGCADFICIDISFLSLSKVLPCLIPFSAGADMVTLVKPQFEIRHKKSVIRDPKIHREVLRAVIESASCMGYTIQCLTYSPVKGTEGNIEYLLHLRRDGEGNLPDISAVVRDAHSSL